MGDHGAVQTEYARPTGIRLGVLTVAVATGMLLAALDASIVGTAMPTVVASLGGLEIFSWVFAGYALVSTTAMPIFGRLSDVYGRKRLYLFGMGLFVLASALCGLAQDMVQLVAFRALQGVGGAAIFALTFAIIGDLYPPERRGYVSGVTSSMWAIASVAGPTLGAVLTETVGWRWVFLVNLPVSLLPIVSLSFLLREPPRPAPAEGFPPSGSPLADRPTLRPRVDVAGAATLTGAIVLVLLAAQFGGKTIPWLSLPMALVFVAVGGLVWLFVRIQRRAQMPTIPLELFRERMFVLGTLASFAFGWVAFTLTAFVPMFVQGVIGGGARAAGIAVLAQSLAWSVAAAAGGPLVRPLGYRRMNLLGFGLVGLGYLGLLRLGPGSPLIEVVFPMIVMGLGNGACSVSQLLAVQNSVEPRFLGVATSLAMFFRNVGFAVGVSVLGAVQVGRLAERNGGVLPDTTGLLLGEVAAPALQAALAGSVHDAWTVSLVLLALGLAAASQMTAWRVVGASTGAARSAAGAAGD